MGGRDEHPSKAEFQISVTEEGIAICVNDEHPKKQSFQLKLQKKESKM